MNSAYRVLEQFHREHLHFPPYIAAFNEVDNLVGLYRETGIAQHMLIIGEAGTGKTTLCRDITRKYPRFALPHQNVIPVLHVPIPPAASIGSVAEAILNRLGDPAPTLGTVSTRSARAIKLIKMLRVELLLFDEAQHVQDRGRQATHYAVGDWLKLLVDEISVPTVLVGLPRTETLLQVNEQLRRRFTRKRDMRMGQDKEASVEAECLQLFISLGATLPIQLDAGKLGWDEFGSRVYFACDGRVAYVKKLLAGAIRLAVERELPRIDPELLSEAFTNDIWWEGIGKLNPFSESFVFRRLNRPNEPFERGQTGRERRYRQAQT